MPAAPTDTTDPDSEAEKKVVEDERENLREFIKGLSPADIKSGNWFTQLLSTALDSYTEKATWGYFQEKYAGVPADGIVEERIRMAARYAAIEGGLSAAAYTAAIVATLGTAGGAGFATVPAGIATVMVDVAFVTQLQIRLAYDIAVLYRVPLDTTDPDDLWKLIRVAFTIKSGEAVREGVVKVVPAIVRPLIKRYFAGSVLASAKALPIVGKFILQRNVIKIGIPGVGVPLAVVLNRYSTLIAGRHAQAVFRNEARIIEIATRLTRDTHHPQLMLWVAWLTIMADGKIADDESLLMRHLVSLVQNQHQVVDDELSRLIDINPEDVWRRIDSETGDLHDVLDAANRIATIDGDLNAREKKMLAELESRCKLT